MPRKPAPLSLSVVVRSWKLSLEARNLSQRTVEQYTDSLALFAAFIGDRALQAVSRDDVASFLADQVKRLRASSALTRYKALRLFFEWCVEEEELAGSPMASMKPPTVPELAVPVLTPSEVKALLKSCAGKDFESRRDLAILALLFDTGIRRAECANLTLDDVDMDTKHVRVLGKGRRSRVVPFGTTTARALDRWLRVRTTHVNADSEPLWLGTKGRAFGSNALRLMLDRRSKLTGVKVHAHMFRHSFAHNHLANGGNEGDLMMLAGWKSRQMVSRYANSTAAERARNAYKSPLDLL